MVKCKGFPALRAAMKRLGGNVVNRSGKPALHIVKRGTNGATVNIYLSAEEAAEKARINYQSKDGEL